LSQNLGALTSWNPLGLSRPVMGLLYLLPVIEAAPFQWTDRAGTLFLFPT